MPAKSASQQKAAGAALAAKRGRNPGEQAQRRIRRACTSSMSEKQLDEFASTKRKGKPEHVRKSH